MPREILVDLLNIHLRPFKFTVKDRNAVDVFFELFEYITLKEKDYTKYATPVKSDLNEDPEYEIKFNKSDILSINKRRLLSDIYTMEYGEKRDTLWGQEKQERFMKHFINEKYRQYEKTNLCISEEELGCNAKNIHLSSILQDLEEYGLISLKDFRNELDFTIYEETLNYAGKTYYFEGAKSYIKVYFTLLKIPTKSRVFDFQNAR